MFIHLHSTATPLFGQSTRFYWKAWANKKLFNIYILKEKRTEEASRALQVGTGRGKKSYITNTKPPPPPTTTTTTSAIKTTTTIQEILVICSISHPVVKNRRLTVAKQTMDRECCHAAPNSLSQLRGKQGMCSKSSKYITSQQLSALLWYRGSQHDCALRG